MSTTAARKHKAPTRGKRRGTRQLSLPETASTIEIGGKKYIVAPESDMTEWLEDLEDIMDSMDALNEPGVSIPWADVKASLGLAKSPQKPRPGNLEYYQRYQQASP